MATVSHASRRLQSSIRQLTMALQNLTTAARPEQVIRARAEALLAYLADVPVAILIANNHKSAVIGEANNAGSFSVAGLKATTLIPFKIPHQMVAFYHQKWDRPDVMTIEPLWNVLKVAVEWICHDGD